MKSNLPCVRCGYPGKDPRRQKGGINRAKNLTKKRMVEIAKKANEASQQSRKAITAEMNKSKVKLTVGKVIDRRFGEK